MSHKPGKKESRIKISPDKKRLKGIEFIPSPLVEEVKSVSDTVLRGDEIQGLSIRLEDLEQLHPPRSSPELKTPVSRRFLVRKKRPQESRKKSQFLVAYPAASHIAVKNLDYSGTDGLQFDVYGQILPHSILGSLQELKKEALARGNTQMAGLVTDSPSPGDLLFTAGRKKSAKSAEEQSQAFRVPLRHYGALENWSHHTALRQQQMTALSRQLQRPAGELLMSLSDRYRWIQEGRYIIDRTLAAVDYGKGYRVGSEFWQQVEPIGDEVSGLMTTLMQCERGYPAPFTHVGKTPSILQETGENFSSPVRKHSCKWDDSLYLLQRRNELREILRQLNFTQVDIDGLEVIGKGQPYTSVSVENFLLPEEEEETSTGGQKDTDPLWEYPDVVSDVIFGPSLQFCGKAARWVGAIGPHRDEVGICVRITFEVLAFERALSVLEISNDGTTAIWYEWRRLPHISNLEQIPKHHKIQRFYFNISAGVILPGESIDFPFLFKSPNAGIFSEAWQFCTHPVLLGGASLQVSLWGIALYEDKQCELRQAIETELEERQALVIAKALVQELFDSIRSPEPPLTPVDAYISEEQLFHRKNPQLYYQYHIVKEIHQLWKQYLDIPSLEEGIDTQYLQAKEEWQGTKWNLSFDDFKQAVMLLPEEEIREALLFHLNKSILEMGFPSEKARIMFLYHICLQLWREAIDGLVNCSVMLRSVLGMPEKEFIMEGSGASIMLLSAEEDGSSKKSATGGGSQKTMHVDQKRSGKGRKEDKRASIGSEEKKGAVGKEEKKGSAKPVGKDKTAEKEERPLSKKKKPLKIQSQVKSVSRESFETYPSDSQMDPAKQEKYQETLYKEVYGLLEALIEHFVFFSEELRSRTFEEQEEEEYQLIL